MRDNVQMLVLFNLRGDIKSERKTQIEICYRRARKYDPFPRQLLQRGARGPSLVCKHVLRADLFVGARIYAKYI